MNIEIKNYSEKALLITGEDTRTIKGELKQFCVWNRVLKGWITKPENREKVEALVSKLKN